ncbi:MAG TPA: cupredoxin domain-containing protein [Jiangellaceae bacterium]
MAAALLAGCGGTAEQSSTGEHTTAESPAPAPVSLEGIVTDHGVRDMSGTKTVELTVELGDSYFSPTYVKVDPGAEVSVHLVNDGATEHTFTIDSLSVDQTLAPGEESDASFTMPDSNAVRFYCRFHAASGMQGAAYSEPGQTVAG